MDRSHAAGTVIVRDLVPGIFGSGPSELTPFAGRLYFSAGALGVSDGSAAGTHLLVPQTLVREAPDDGGGFLFFVASSADGEELWRTDGTSAGTVLVKDIASGPASSSPDQLAALGSVVCSPPPDPTAASSGGATERPPAR